MTLKEIKQAVDEGKIVRWTNALYTVKHCPKSGYVIECSRGNTIGLTWTDGTTMNGQESEFYIDND